MNRFSGEARIDGQKIEIGTLVMTLRAGPPALLDQEAKYTAALKKVNQFRIDENGLLYLLDAAGNEILRFSRMEK